jgi:uncharacterized heparinase superfamily protein
MPVGQQLLNALYGSGLYRFTLKGRAPKSLRGVPPDPWAAPAEEGAAVLAGEFTLLGRPVLLGDSPWQASGLAPAAAAELHAFGWLGGLARDGGEAARTRARGLVAGWIAACGRFRPLPWRADVLGARLKNWLANFGLIAGGGEGHESAVLESLAIQARHLTRVAARAERDARQFAVIDGLVAGGVSLPGLEAGLYLGLDLLDDAIRRQVLPDGGHFQRNPTLQLKVLERLVGVRETLLAAHVEVPVALQGAIDRMAPMLRAFRHGDGRLALFNGGNEEEAVAVERALERAGAGGRAVDSAPHTGFQRLNAGRTVAIVDAGAGLVSGADANAHAGVLSFEMSVGRHRLVVNCGAHPDAASPWHQALRATAAHSTVAVDDTNAVETLIPGSSRRAPPTVTCRRSEENGSLFLQLSHDGYARSIGLAHNRDVYLSAKGDDMRGKDVLTGKGGRAFAARFHLHPEVQAQLAGDGASVLLRLPSGAGWRFRATGGRIGLEESVYLGVLGRLRRAEQIVVSGGLAGAGSTVKWSFRHEGRKRA